MKEIIAKSANFTGKDAINSKNGIALQEIQGEIEIVKCAKVKSTEEDGSIKNVSVLVTSDNQVFTGISASVYDTLDDLILLIDTEGSQRIRFDSRTAKNGRNFIALTLL